MEITINDVSVRCMGCSQLGDLHYAAKNAWKMCQNCNFVICEQCFHLLPSPKKCLSFICTQKNRILIPVMLPIEKILIFAREHNNSLPKEGLLYKLFYEKREKIQTLPYFSATEASARPDQSPTTIQSETWKNFSLVITKRKRGKFISWERV